MSAAFGGEDFGVENGAHLGAVLGLDGVGVIPEIEAVGVFVVEPQAGVMGVIDALAGAGRERVAARDGDAFVGDERIEGGLFERRGPVVRGEGLAVDGDVNAAIGFIGDNLYRSEERRVGKECRSRWSP